MSRSGSRDLAALAEAAAKSGYPAVRLEQVGRVYGSGPTAVAALKDVDLEIWPGEFVVLLGPSGSGKTTLLNVVGGIEEPTSGRILVAGKDITSFGSKARSVYRRDRVGFVFQFFNIVPTLTALENVEVIAKLTGKGTASAAARHSNGSAWPRWLIDSPDSSRAVSNRGWPSRARS